MAILKTKLSKISIKNENATDNVNIDKIIVIPLLKNSRFSDNNRLWRSRRHFLLMHLLLANLLRMWLMDFSVAPSLKMSLRALI